MKLKIIKLFIPLLVSFPNEDINKTLDKASENKVELSKVITHYKSIDKSPEKYEAAIFLLENMHYHYSRGQISLENEALEQWRLETDSIYYSLSKDKSISELQNQILGDSLSCIQKRRRDHLNNYPIPKITVHNDFYWDCQEISSDFLINHIDNAFKVWKSSKYARHLTFDEFKEYILPYRSIKGYGFNTSGRQFNEYFSKHVLADTSSSLREHIQRYNLAVNGMRNLNGKDSRKGGIYDLYSNSFHDCVDIASYGCNILRACGIPTVVEYNICYRDFSGRHFHCNTYNTNKEWQTFNPESSLPGDGDWAFAHTLNVYRQLYGAQRNTPFFLKNNNEYTPPLLSSPCIKDVTSNFHKTVAIELPFLEKPSNRLAYLGTFHKASNGLLPVTWGEIDTLSNKVCFEHAIPNIIYFPIYYPDSDFKAFGEPFYVKIDSDGKASLLPIPGVDNRKKSLITLDVNRKFPQKTNMLKAAQQMVGGRFLGANKEDFSDAKVLYEINEVPKPYFLNYHLKNRKKYQYYRFQSLSESPNDNISMIEWLTRKKFKYPYTCEPSRSHIINPDEVKRLKKEPKFVQFINAFLVSALGDNACVSMKNVGNMQYAPHRIMSFTLQSPQVVTDIRFATKNADNGITTGDQFELYYWNDGWIYGGDCEAEYEYVSFENIPANKLYWLVNKTRGKEELVFTMIDGEQSFLYYDMLNE